MRRSLLTVITVLATTLAAAAIVTASGSGESSVISVGDDGHTNYAQNGPAIAVDPKGSQQRAVVAADDYQPEQPGSAPPHTRLAFTPDWTSSAWSATPSTGGFAAGILKQAAGTTSGGAVSAVWGIGSDVFVAEEGRPASQSTSICSPSAGVFVGGSTTAGASWSLAGALPVRLNTTTTVRDQPAIAFDPNVGANGRLYVAYRQSDWNDSNTCGSDSPDASSIGVALSDDDGQTWRSVTVSPPASSLASTPLFARPAIAVLDDGRVAVTFADVSAPPSAILEETCTIAPSTYQCGPSTASPVGPATVIAPSVGDPSPVAGLAAVPPTPVIAATPAPPSTEAPRIVVAWSQSTDSGGAQVYTASSEDGGTTFTPPERASTDTSGGNEIEPQLSPAPDDSVGPLYRERIDLAYLDDEGHPGQFVVWTTSSNRPTVGTDGETWSQDVPISTTPALSAAAGINGVATFGKGFGIASPLTNGAKLPSTLVVYADTRNVSGATPQDQDVYSVWVKHGITSPVVLAQTAEAKKNVATVLPLTASDADGDPLTYAIVGGTSQPGATATVPDPNRPDVSYQGPHGWTGTDALTIRVSDGVNSTDAQVTVNVVNTAPQVSCILTTYRNVQLPVPLNDCATDPNGDALTVAASGATHGVLTTAAGQTTFTPEDDYVGDASITISASDGQATTTAAITVHVIPTPEVATVSIDKPTTVHLLAGHMHTFHATVRDQTGAKPTVSWTWGDGTPASHGATASHTWLRAGTYHVKASVSGSTRTAVATVIVTRPMLSLVSATWSHGRVLRLKLQTRARGRLTASTPGHSAHQSAHVASGTHVVSLHLHVHDAPKLGTIVLVATLAPSHGAKASIRRTVIVSLNA